MAGNVSSVDATQKAFNAQWAEAEVSLLKKDTGKFLGALAFQEIDYEALDQSLREVVALVDTNLNRPNNAPVQGVPPANPDYIGLPIAPPGKVVVQPRGSFASRTSLRGHVDLDLDLVFPKNYKIVFAGPPAAPAIRIERTICQVLGCPNPFLPAPGDGHDATGNLVVTRDGLRLVMLYIWGRLLDVNFVLPNNFTALPLNILPAYTIPIPGAMVPNMIVHPTKTLATLTRSISAQILGNAAFPNLDVDFFIKVVSTRFGGEEVLVGVDKDGPLGIRQYQTTTFIPSGKEWVGNKRLSPVDRTALLALKWWKNSFANDATIGAFKVRNANHPDQLVDGQRTDIKLKSHHFLSTLNALHELPPTDPLYVPTNTSLPFSLVRVIDVMLKILTFLQRAYQPAQRFNIVYTNAWDNNIPQNAPKALYPFPQVSCGIFETLHKQVTSNNLEFDAIINSKVIPTFSARLKKALDDLAKEGFKPDTYTYEEL